MKLIRPRPTFDVQEVPGYGMVRFIAGSPKALSSPDAFVYAKENGGFLPGAGLSVVRRVAFHKDNEVTKQGLDGSELYQRTSTFSLKFPGERGFQAAFVELPDEDASYDLVNQVYKENHADRELIKPVTDSLVARLIEQAQSENRVVDVLMSNPLKLETEKSKGQSAYGRHPYVIALFGSADIAELNAEYLHDDRNRDFGFVYDFTASDLENLMKGREGHALIRPVGLGGGVYGRINDVYASSGDFRVDGRACGVVPSARNFPDGRK